MAAYFDTSILLPIVINRHENNQAARELLRSCLKNGQEIFTVLHTYGEMYNHLTRNVTPFQLSPTQAQHVLLELLPQVVNFRSYPRAYHAAIQRCVKTDLRRAVVYDAIHLEAAIEGGADILYTDNTKDFNRLLSDDDSIRIQGIR
jgi:predicted nucleic acid-binding protein